MSSTVPNRYRIVDHRELGWARATSLLLVLLWLPVTLGVLGALLSSDGDDTVTLALVGLMAVACLIRFVTWLPVAWRADPLLVVDRDGIEIRLERYGDNGRSRRVRLPWPEIAWIGIATAPTHPATRPHQVAAVEAYLGYQLHQGLDTLAAHRWSGIPGQKVVVVAIQPRSAVQAEEFARQLDVLRRAVETLRRRQAGLADRIGAIAEKLDDWQRTWPGSTPRIGMHVAVRGATLDTIRLAAAVRAYGHDRDLRQLPPLHPTQLDTPHDIARLLANSASLTALSD